MALEIGWSIKMSCGQRAKIINIVNENDIDVEFEDGGIVEHTTYHKLLMRGFRSPIEKQNNPRKITYDKVKEVFEGKGYILLTQEYINPFSPLMYICKKHPDKIQKTNWNKIQQGSGCRECGYEKVSNKLALLKRTPYEEVLEKFKKENLVLLTTKEEYFSEPNPLMKFICPCSPDTIQEKNWTTFQQVPHCSICYKEKKSADRRKEHYEEFVRRCNEKGYIPISKLEDYKNVSTPMKYVCPLHGEQQTNLSHLREGKGCKQCGYITSGEKLKLSKEDLTKRLEKKELALITECNTVHDIGIFQCLNHPEVCFKSRISDVVYSDVKCPACHESKGEKKIRLWLKENKIEFEPQKKFEDLYRFEKNNKLSYDFYIPYCNLLIEYQGEFHDGTAWQQSEEQYEQQKIKDELKKNYAKKNGYNFIEIWYWDYKNIESLLEKELKKYEYTIS